MILNLESILQFNALPNDKESDVKNQEILKQEAVEIPPKS